MAEQDFVDTESPVSKNMQKFLDVLKMREKLQRQKTIGAIVVAALLLLLVATGLGWFILRGNPSFPGSQAIDFLKIPITIVTFLGFGSVLLASMLKYLEPVSKSRANRRDAELHFLNQRLMELSEFVMNGGGPGVLDEAEKSDMLAKVAERINDEAIASLLPKIQDELELKYRRNNLDQRFDQMAGRLQRETTDLARRGNLNLGLGMLTTLMGLFVLGWAVYQTPATTDVQILLAYFLPRLSLVVLIEVFAYFFLRLYKESLGGIKYFQNELTNVESRQIALEAALQSNLPDLQSYIVQALSNTERNIIINKDQTTVELERERISKASTIGVLDQVKQMLKRDEKE